jgi:hypothetical protein
MRDGKSKSVDKKQDVNNRFMGVLYRNSDPAADPPRTEFFLWQNPNLNKMEKVRFGDNRHVTNSKWKLAVGVDGRNNRSNGALPLPLGRHWRDERAPNFREAEERLNEKVKLGLGNQKGTSARV